MQFLTLLIFRRIQRNSSNDDHLWKSGFFPHACSLSSRDRRISQSYPELTKRVRFVIVMKWHHRVRLPFFGVLMVIHYCTGAWTNCSSFYVIKKRNGRSMHVGGIIWQVHRTGILCMILLSTSDHKMLYLQLLWVLVRGHDNRAMSEIYEMRQSLVCLEMGWGASEMNLIRPVWPSCMSRMKYSRLLSSQMISAGLKCLHFSRYEKVSRQSVTLSKIPTGIETKKLPIEISSDGQVHASASPAGFWNSAFKLTYL
jgi:hypothetical protein